MKKKIWLCSILILIILTSVSVAKGQYKNVQIFFDNVILRINGQSSSLPLNAMIYQGTVYLPIRSIGEVMGAEVTWLEANQNSPQRVVNIDFTLPQGDLLIDTSDRVIYQYVAMEKNQIIAQFIEKIKLNRLSSMTSEINRLLALEEIAENIGDDEMKEWINKMTFSAEIIRSGHVSKTLTEYEVAKQLFLDAEIGLSNHINNSVTALKLGL